MMFTIYVYVLQTMADWELGNVTAELNSRRFFRKGARPVTVKTVGLSREPVKTMGGMTIIPDRTIDDMAVSRSAMLVLPGAERWNDSIHGPILEIAEKFLSSGGGVCAICGATAALADRGMLDARPHTSNGPGYLEMVSPNYRGQGFYVDKPSVADQNLITAGSAGALLWAKQIIDHLDIFQSDTLESWYDYFRTGDPRHFFALMQTLPSRQED